MREYLDACIRKYGNLNPLASCNVKPFVLSSMQYKLFVLQLRATIQTVCIAGGSSYHTCYVYSLAGRIGSGAIFCLPICMKAQCGLRHPPGWLSQ